jgi:hypothetical protein
MTTAALAKLEANAPDIAQMLTVFANEQRVRIRAALQQAKTSCASQPWRRPRRWQLAHKKL